MKIKLIKIVWSGVFLTTCASIISLQAQTSQTVTLKILAPGGSGTGSSTNFLVPSNVVAQISYAYIPSLSGYSGSIRVSFDGVTSSLWPFYTSISAPLPTFIGPATISLIGSNTIIDWEWGFIEAPDASHFVTSDNPVYIFNGGVAYPLNPKLFLVIGELNKEGLTQADSELVDIINLKTIVNAYEYVFASKNLPTLNTLVQQHLGINNLRDW